MERQALRDKELKAVQMEEMTSTAEVAPEEKMNVAAASSWQLHHFSDLWGVIKKKNVHVLPPEDSRAFFIPQIAAVAC